MFYFDELTKAMDYLAEDPRTIFMGQAVDYPGTGMFGSLTNVPIEKRLELPVAEDLQLGMAIGMSLNGFVPICIYPRINFLLLATNQLILHLDKLPLYSDFKPKVIIRTAVATPNPLNPGPQHLGDFSEALDEMLDTVYVVRLTGSRRVLPLYQEALNRDVSTILVEYMDQYES